VSSKKGIALIIILLLFFYVDAEAQCAICKQAASSSLDNNPNSVAKGLNTGILYLLALPYLLIAFIFRKQILSLWKSWRGKKATDELL
jgi:hypothetical protein